MQNVLKKIYLETVFAIPELDDGTIALARVKSIVLTSPFLCSSM